MRRPHVTKDRNIFKAFPIVWRCCENCKYEFKFESGWCMFGNPPQYLCKKCFPKRMGAVLYFLDRR